jgi:hypothetical protein
MPTAAERPAALEAEVAALRVQVQEVLTQNPELRARRANAPTDRPTSSTPPSRDPLARPRRQRRRSGKQSGGHRGHRGETRHLVAVPDELVAHRPAVCRALQTPLDATAAGAGYERRLRDQLGAARALPARPAGACGPLPRGMKLTRIGGENIVR